MTSPAHPLRRRIGVLALHLALLALPVLTGWHEQAQAANTRTAHAQTANVQAPGRQVAIAQATVTIDNFTFSPAELTVPPGTTVTWVNHDDIPHTVVEENKSFRSKALDTDDTFSFTFMKPGDFTYFCSLHPHMTGKITVKPSAS
jgi:plastocyanin